MPIEDFYQKYLEIIDKKGNYLRGILLDVLDDAKDPQHKHLLIDDELSQEAKELSSRDIFHWQPQIYPYFATLKKPRDLALYDQKVLMIHTNWEFLCGPVHYPPTQVNSRLGDCLEVENIYSGHRELVAAKAIAYVESLDPDVFAQDPRNNWQIRWSPLEPFVGKNLRLRDSSDNRFGGQIHEGTCLAFRPKEESSGGRYAEIDLETDFGLVRTFCETDIRDIQVLDDNYFRQTSRSSLLTDLPPFRFFLWSYIGLVATWGQEIEGLCIAVDERFINGESLSISLTLKIDGDDYEILAGEIQAVRLLRVFSLDFA